MHEGLSLTVHDPTLDMAKTQTDPRSRIIELADLYGHEFILKEMVAQMSGDDAREFVDWMERNKDNF